MKRKKLLFVNSCLLSLYFFVSLPYYLIEANKLEGFVIAGALYMIFVVVHEIFILISLVTHWFGYFNNSRGWILFSNWLLFLAGFQFFVSLIVLFPLFILNFIAMGRRQKLEMNIS